MMDYRHKQIGTALLIIMAATMLFVYIITTGKNSGATQPVLLFIGGVSLLFHSLNIEVKEGILKWSFGPGFWRNSVRVEDIVCAIPITTKWYYGLGIRYIPTGWLYTVTGTTAVQIELSSGAIITLGTNDAENLIKAIYPKPSR